MNKQDMFIHGMDLQLRFGKLNNFPLPLIKEHSVNRKWMFRECAYYRAGVITISLNACAAVGRAGPAWSYPGYTVDRTPYGVLAHELGHHVDYTKSTVKGRYYGDYSVKMRAETGEAKLTNYCPNDAEWFAEIFRLFVTNPELLRYLRPKTYAALRKDFEPPEKRSWAQVLVGAPQRTIAAASKKIQLSR